MRTKLAFFMTIATLLFGQQIHWKSDSIVRIDEYLILHSDTLVIEPGCTVLFDTAAGLSVDDNAHVIAVGTASKPITFSISKEYAGEEIYYWKYFHIDSGTAELKYVDFHSAEMGLFASNKDFQINFSHLTFTNCYTGISLSGGDISGEKPDTLRHILTRNCINGIETCLRKQQKLYISHSTLFCNVGVGTAEFKSQIAIVGNGTHTIENSIIYNQYGYGIQRNHNAGTPQVLSNYNLYNTGLTPLVALAPGDNDLLQTAPLFADTASGDFRLRRNSPAIDKGNPLSDFSFEPSGGGGRVNMGYYGNTPDAALLKSEAIISSTQSKNSSATFTKGTLYSNTALNSVQVYSVQGEIVFEKKCRGANTVTIPVEEFTPGIYLLRGLGEKGQAITTQKIVIQ